ncbi:MAG: FkbM family methyltransferase [Pirellulaceae bacterium]|jgi:FkbM family methyltransferase
MPSQDKLKLLFRAYKYRYRVERNEIAFVLENLKPGQNCVDIGAHKGAFTYWMQRRVGPAGHVHAFEPQPELAEYLSKMKTAFGMNHVTIVHSAVSDQSGFSRLYRDSACTPGATLNDRESETANSVVVPLVTLDGYFSQQPACRVDFIKCDVEGHELEVFQGGCGILTEDRPKLLFECEQRHMSERSMEEVFQYLVSLGYRGWYFKRRNLHSIDSFKPELNAAPRDSDYVYNFVFLHPMHDAARRAA